jgi:hypothetical protein
MGNAGDGASSKPSSNTQGDAPVATADNLPVPANVTRRYKPGGNVFATRIRN